MADESPNEALLKISSDVDAAVNDLKRIAASLDAIKASAEQTKGGLEKASSGFTDLQANVITVTAALEAAKIVYEGTRKVLEALSSVTVDAAVNFGKFAQELDNTSRIIGTGSGFVQVLQAMRIRLAEMGQGADTGSYAIRIFSRTIEQAATGSGQAALTFQRLGLSVRDSAGIIRPTEAILSDVAQAFGRMDEGAAKVALSMELFGRQGPLLLPVLGQMAHGTAEFTAELERMGLLLSEKSLQAGREFNQEYAKIETTFGVATHQLGAFMAEALLPLVKQLAEDAPEGLKLFNAALGSTEVILHDVLVPFQAVAAVLHGIATVTRLLSVSGESVDWWKENAEGADKTADATKKAAAADVDFIAQQKKSMRDSAEAFQQAADARQQALVAETQGRKAELNVQLTNDTRAIEQRRQDALEDARNAVDSHQLSVQQIKAIDVKFFYEDQAARQKYLQDTQTLETTQGNAIAKLHLEGQQVAQLADVKLQEEAAKQRYAARRITETDLTKLLQGFEEQRYQIELYYAEQEAKLPSITTNPEKYQAALNKITAIKSAHATKMAELDVSMADQDRKMTADRATALDKLADLEAKAFGTDTQKQVYDLILAEQKLEQEFIKQGQPDGAIDRLRKAYGAMIAEAQGATINLGNTFKTTFSDILANAITHTRSFSDIFAQMKMAIVKNFTDGFAEALVKKLGFDHKFRLNMTQDIPAAAGEGAAGMAKNFSAAFDLMSGGPGRGTSANVSGGIASWAGGAASGVESFAHSIFSSSNFVAGSGPGSTQLQSATDYAQLNGPQQFSGPGSTENQLATEQSGQGGGLSSVGVAGAAAGGALIALSNTPRPGGRSGSASGFIGAIGAGLSTGNPYGALIAAAVYLIVSGIQTAIKRPDLYRKEGLDLGTLALGSILGISNNESQNLSYGLTLGASYQIAEIAKLAGLFQVPTLEHQDLTAIGKKISAAGIPFGLSAPIQSTTLGRDPRLLLSAIQQGKGDATLARLFPGLSTTSAADIQQYIAGGAAPPGLLAGGAGLDQFAPTLYEEPSQGGLVRAGGGLAGLGEAMTGDAQQASQFANAMTNNFRLLGLSADEAKKYVLAFADANKVTLVNALAALNKQLLENSLGQNLYNEDVKGLVNLFADLPKGVDSAVVALQYVDDINGKSIVDVDKLSAALTYLKQTLDSVAQSALSAGIGALSTALSLTPAQIADLKLQEDTAERQYALSQAAHVSQIETLNLQIDQARLFGDTVTDAQLRMQRASEEAAMDQEKINEQQRLADKAAADALATPQGAMRAALQKAVRDAITSGIVDAFVTSGVIQAALAPFFTTLKKASDVFGDPNATAAQTASAWDAINQSLTQVGPNMTRVMASLYNTANTLGGVAGATSSIPAYASGGLVTRPTLALVGEAGPEMIVPLTRGHGANAAVNISYVFTGNTIMSDRDASRLGRIVADTHMRTLRQNSLVG